MIASAMPEFAAHWEVWALSLAIVLGGLYVTRVIGPKVVAPGEKVVSRRQVFSFSLAVVFMTAVAIWPLHDISEQRLYSAHMFQHLVLTLIVPPLFLLSCPKWLADLVVGSDGRVWHITKRLAAPLVAWGIFNAYNLLSHMQPFVNTAASNGPFHFGAHVLFVLTALLMWVPVCGPWPELRLSLPGQMVYLFAQSIIPTLPAAWLANSSNVVYDSYDQPVRLFGISALNDQTAAGLIMKVAEVAYLWVLITVMFFKWAARHQEAERQGLVLTESEIRDWEAGGKGGLSGSPVADASAEPPSGRS
jgi:putative membrane protein